MAFLPVKHEKLRKGLFVKLNGSWLNHPFPTNTFKISTTKELETLKKLKNVEILFDPEKSDPETEDEEKERQEETLQASPEVEVGDQASTEAEVVEEVVQEGPPAKLQPVEAFSQYCEGLKKFHRAYQEAYQQIKAFMQDLSVGNIEGIQKRVLRKKISSIHCRKNLHPGAVQFSRTASEFAQINRHNKAIRNVFGHITAVGGGRARAAAALFVHFRVHLGNAGDRYME